MIRSRVAWAVFAAALAGCSGPVNPPVSSVPKDGVVWAHEDSLSFALDVAANEMSWSFVHVDPTSVRVREGDVLNIPFHVSLEFPEGSNGGYVLYSDMFVVMVPQDRRGQAVVAEDIEGTQSWQAALVPAGTRSLRFQTEASDVLMDGDLRLLGLVATGTVAFQIRATYQLPATYGGRSEGRANGTSFDVGPVAQLSPGDPNYPYRSTQAIAVAGRPMFGFGAVQYPGNASNVGQDIDRAQLHSELACNAEEITTTLDGGFPERHDFDPPAPQNHPRLYSSSIRWCPAENRAGEVGVDLTYRSLGSSFRSYGFAAGFDGYRVLTDLVNSVP